MKTAFARQEIPRWPERRVSRMWDGDVSLLCWEAADRRAPSVHFAHANGFNALAYRSLLDPLSEDMRVYASDLRGHGRSTVAANPKGMRSWLIYRDDLVRLLPDIDGRPKILAGHSMGATASLAAAAAAGAWVAGLVLVEPVIMPAALLRRIKLLRAFGMRGRGGHRLRRQGIFPSREAMLEHYRSRGAFQIWPEQIVRDFVEGGTVEYLDDRQVRLACTPGWEAANYRESALDIWPMMASIRCPVTLVVGGKRSTCPASVVDELVRLKPDIRVVSVPEASHFLPMEEPYIVRREIRLMAALRPTGRAQ